MSDTTQTFINVLMPPDLKRKARIEAAHRGVSMSDFVRTLLEKELSAPAQQAADASEQPTPSVAS